MLASVLNVLYLLLGILSAFPIQCLLHGGTPGTKQSNAAKGVPSTSQLTNVKDVQFLLMLTMGRQHLRVVLDTGSPDLLLASRRCPITRCPMRSFDPRVSRSYRKLRKAKMASFGSGQVFAEEAQDQMSFASHGPLRQSFWEITNMSQKMRTLWDEATFDGILGLAPSGGSTTAQSHSEAAVLSNFDVDAFTVYLGRAGSWSSASPSGKNYSFVPYMGAHGTPSCIHWGTSLAKQGTTVAYLDVIGTSYWAVEMTQVRLQDQLKSRSDLNSWNQSSAAVIDTGSSVLQAPPDQFRRLLHLIGPVDRGCANFEQLPDLALSLGKGAKSLEVVLPPRAYIKRLHHTDSYDLCFLRLSESTSIHGDIPVWVLGVPFLQEYACEFDDAHSRRRVGIAVNKGGCPGQGMDANNHLGTLTFNAAVIPGAQLPKDSGLQEVIGAPDGRSLILSGRDVE